MIRKIVSIALICLIAGIPAVGYAQDGSRETFSTGMRDGRASASRYYSSMGWGVGGFFGGLTLGLVGTAVIAGVSQSGSADPPLGEMIRLDGTSNEYQSGFATGYDKRAKAKAFGSAIIGGLAGTALIVTAIVVSVQQEKRPD